MSITGAILAGGNNRRMGGNMKALLQLDGKLFIERQLEEMSKLCSEILIITNQSELFKSVLATQQANVRIISDLLPGKGPLAGLQAAIAAASCEELWAVACDMPLISARAAHLLLQLRRQGVHAGHAIALPMLAGRLHPLHAIYHRRCLRIIDQLLEDECYRLMKLIENGRSAVAEEFLFAQQAIPLDFATNVNDPAELEKLQKQR